jgi:Flp pilus assembly protein protease CpaA
MFFSWEILVCLVAGLGFYDVKTLTLPTKGLAMVWIVTVGLQGVETLFLSFSSIFLLFGVAIVVRTLHGRLFNSEGLGKGDVKLMATAGLWVPVDETAFFLMAVGLLGTLGGLVWQHGGGGRLFPLGCVIAGLMIIWILKKGHTIP